MITIQVLSELSDIIKISQVASKAGLNSHTILSKLRERRDLTTSESKKIENVLQHYHIKIENRDMFRFEDYKHLSAAEVQDLPEDIKAKLLQHYSKIAAENFELIEGDTTVYDY